MSTSTATHQSFAEQIGTILDALDAREGKAEALPAWALQDWDEVKPTILAVLTQASVAIEERGRRAHVEDRGRGISFHVSVGEARRDYVITPTVDCNETCVCIRSGGAMCHRMPIKHANVGTLESWFIKEFMGFLQRRR